MVRKLVSSLVKYCPLCNLFPPLHQAFCSSQHYLFGLGQFSLSRPERVQPLRPLFVGQVGRHHGQGSHAAHKNRLPWRGQFFCAVLVEDAKCVTRRSFQSWPLTVADRRWAAPRRLRIRCILQVSTLAVCTQTLSDKLVLPQCNCGRAVSAVQLLSHQVALNVLHKRYTFFVESRRQNHALARHQFVHCAVGVDARRTLGEALPSHNDVSPVSSVRV